MLFEVKYIRGGTVRQKYEPHHVATLLLTTFYYSSQRSRVFKWQIICLSIRFMGTCIHIV